jgi:hypothetical protein
MAPGPTASRPRLLYIVGYGRSGSTLVDIALSSHERVVSVGEVMYLPDYWLDPGQRCTCGAQFVSCEFWAGLWSSTPPTDLVQAVRRVETRVGSLRVFLGLLTPLERRQHRAYHMALLAHIGEAHGDALVVDSSKIPARMLALVALADADIHVVHLVRNGLGVMESLVKRGSNRALEGHIAPPRWVAARTVLGWTLANMCAALYVWRAKPASCTRIRYEDFTRDPGAMTARILHACGIDGTALGDRLSEGEPLAVGHMVGGNRLRWRSDIRVEARPALPGPLLWRHRLLFGLVGGWLNRRYGYGHRESGGDAAPVR